MFFDRIRRLLRHLGHELRIDELEVNIGHFIANLERFCIALDFDVLDRHLGEFRPMIDLKKRRQRHHDLRAKRKRKLLLERHRRRHGIHQRPAQRLRHVLYRRGILLQKKPQQRMLIQHLTPDLIKRRTELRSNLIFVDDIELRRIGPKQRRRIDRNFGPPIRLDRLDLILRRLGSRIELRPRLGILLRHRHRFIERQTPLLACHRLGRHRTRTNERAHRTPRPPRFHWPIFHV